MMGIKLGPTKIGVRAMAAALLFGVMPLAACGTTFQVANVDPTTGRFAVAARDEVPASAISVRKPFDIDSAKALVYVRSNIAEVPTYDAYFEDQLVKLGYFGEVVRKEEFERKLVQAGKMEGIASIDGFVGLSRASQAYGPFLFIDVKLEGFVGYQVKMDMSVYDPSNATELLKVSHQVTNWDGLDVVLFQPMMNVLVDWIKENSKTYTPPPAPPAEERPTRRRPRA